MRGGGAGCQLQIPQRYWTREASSGKPSGGLFFLRNAANSPHSSTKKLLTLHHSERRIIWLYCLVLKLHGSRQEGTTAGHQNGSADCTPTPRFRAWVTSTWVISLNGPQTPKMSPHTKDTPWSPLVCHGRLRVTWTRANRRRNNFFPRAVERLLNP